MNLLVALSICLAMTSLSLRASTFVGNGGNASDLELAIALETIQHAAENIVKTKSQLSPAVRADKEDSNNLCRCDASSTEGDFCRILEKLTRNQKKQCREILQKTASQLLTLAKNERQQIKYKWSREPTYQKTGEGRRAVDAVTNAENKTIVIHEDHFLQLESIRRVALLTHELYHLIPILGKVRGDFEPVGSFDGLEGGRQMLDVLGISIALYANSIRPSRLATVLNRVSRAHKDHWISMAGGFTILDEGQSKNLIVDKYVGTFNTAYTYVPNTYGLRVGFSRLSTRDNSENCCSFDVSLASNISEVGFIYRLFPSSKIYSWWSQWHINIGISVLYAQHRYGVSDSYVNISEQTNGYGAGLHAESYFPIIKGVWGYIQGKYSHVNLPLEKFGIDMQQKYFGILGGISYGI